ARLSPYERDTRALVLQEAQNLRAQLVCRTPLWDVNGLTGPQIDYPLLATVFVIRNQTDVDNLEARYRATDAQIDQYIANVREGIRTDYVPTRHNVENALAELDTALQVPVDDDPMLRLVFAEQGAAGYDTSALRDAVQHTVRPALARYRDVL